MNVSGLGDLVWPGSDFTPLALINAPDTIAFSSLLFDLYGYKYSWPGITYAEERTLYTEPYQKRLRGLAYDSFVRELEPYENLPPYLRAASFNLTNHFARHLLYHCVFGRSHVEYRLPYFDEDFLSFAYGLPVQLGLERRVQKGIITRYLPTLARIPASADELPVNPDNDTGSWTILMHKLRLRLSRWVTVGRAEHPALYADYENWLRTDLRAWAEAILFDQQTLDRGIFAPAALASLWARHLAGNELWTVGKLASIITFEMTMRSFGR